MHRSKNCRRALLPRGRVAVIELLLGEIGWPGLAPLFDMGMLVMLSGRESPVEYRHLFEAARLTATKVIETETHMAILKAVAP